MEGNEVKLKYKAARLESTIAPDDTNEVGRMG
jgi:hypothetical protein